MRLRIPTKIPKSKKWARRRYWKKVERRERLLKRVAEALVKPLQDSLSATPIMRKVFVVEELP